MLTLASDAIFDGDFERFSYSVGVAAITEFVIAGFAGAATFREIVALYYV